MKAHKIHEYKGYKIQNVPYMSESEPRWFVRDKDMKIIKYIYPQRTLRNAKKEIDTLTNSCQ